MGFCTDPRTEHPTYHFMLEIFSDCNKYFIHIMKIVYIELVKK